MSIVLDEARTLALWYTLLNKDVDVLGCLQLALGDYKETPTHFEFVYRFRYYRDDNIFHSQDEKHWYSVKIKGSQAEAMARIRSILERMIVLVSDNHVQPKLEEIVHRPGHWQEFQNEFFAKPWMHASTIPGDMA